MKKTLLLLILILVQSILFCQEINYNSYLSNAKKQFMSGDYNSAKRHLMVYKSLTNKKEPVFMSKIDSCIVLYNMADSFLLVSQYEEVLTCYKKIIEINPSDNKVMNRITKMEGQIENNKCKVSVFVSHKKTYAR